MTAEPAQDLPVIHALGDLEAMLPRLRTAYADPGDRMEAFAAQADPILEHAAVLDRCRGGDDCRTMAATRIEAMLEAAGWIDSSGKVLD